ncbi:MAG: hypothetical protein WDO74_23075 [Pseudomonadota bacterium]
MAFRNIAVPWLSSGLVLLGYAAFSWRRAKRATLERSAPKALPRHEAVEPLSARLEHIPEEHALDLEPERLPANNNALPRAASLGALFLGRASDALSPFQVGPQWPAGRR